MPTKPHRVLVDLSPATEGFAGIPQESRLILQSLWQTDGIEPTGLLFDADIAVIGHRFQAGADRTRRLENHAQFMYSISDRKSIYSKIGIIQNLQKARIAMRCLLGLHAQMQALDNEFHGETTWRLFLSKSLGGQGLALARKCPMMLTNLSRKVLKLRSLLGLPGISLDASAYDFVLVHDSVPLKVSPDACKLVRYHDMIPALRPELTGSRWQIHTHLRGIRRCQQDSVFVCNSEPTRTDLLRVFPDLYDRAVLIPDLLSDEMYADPEPGMLASIWENRQAAKATGKANFAERDGLPPYLLLVSTIEPRKNHLVLIRAFEKLISQRDTDLVLMFVGAAGWKNEEILQAMRPLMNRGRLIYLEKVPLQELRVLYTHAEAVVFPSFYEGFGYCPLEAMQCGTPAIASDIAAHRWVYGDAVLYCDPFDSDDLRGVIERLAFTDRDRLRRRLIEAGHARVRRYLSETIGRQWFALCEEIRRQGGGRNVGGLKLSQLAMDEPRLPAIAA